MVHRRQFLKSAGVAGVAGLTATAGCIGDFGSQPYGDGTLTFLMSPSEPQDFMMSQYRPYADHLEENIDADIEVELEYSSSYSAILQALDSGTGNVAETGPFAAALGVMDDRVEVALQRYAFGQWEYPSVIVTTEDTDISEPADLEGGEIAFADTLSASGSLYPLFMLQDAGLDIGNAPETDEGADFDATWSGHAEAFEALTSGQADAAGVGRFIATDDNQEYQEGIVEVDIYEGIPRAPIVTSPELSDDEHENVVEALNSAPEEVYYGADGEEGTDDDLWFSDVRPIDVETYEPVVEVAQTLGIEIDLLEQGAADE